VGTPLSWLFIFVLNDTAKSEESMVCRDGYSRSTEKWGLESSTPYLDCKHVIKQLKHNEIDAQIQPELRETGWRRRFESPYLGCRVWL